MLRIQQLSQVMQKNQLSAIVPFTQRAFFRCAIISYWDLIIQMWLLDWALATLRIKLLNKFAITRQISLSKKHPTRLLAVRSKESPLEAPAEHLARCPIQYQTTLAQHIFNLPVEHQTKFQAKLPITLQIPHRRQTSRLNTSVGTCHKQNHLCQSSLESRQYLNQCKFLKLARQFEEQHLYHVSPTRSHWLAMCKIPIPLAQY